MSDPTADDLDRLAVALLPIVFPAAPAPGPAAPGPGPDALARAGERQSSRQDRPRHA